MLETYIEESSKSIFKRKLRFRRTFGVEIVKNGNGDQNPEINLFSKYEATDSIALNKWVINLRPIPNNQKNPY